MTLEEIQYKAQSIMQEWKHDDSAPYIEFVEELASMNIEYLSEDLEKEIERYTKEKIHLPITYKNTPMDIMESDWIKCAYHFVQWQKEQMMNYVQGKYDAYQEEYDDYYAGLRVAYGDMVKKLKED